MKKKSGIKKPVGKKVAIAGKTSVVGPIGGGKGVAPSR